MSPVHFKECQCRMSLSPIFMPMWNIELKKKSHVMFLKCQNAICHISNPRNECVSLSNLKVKGHTRGHNVYALKVVNLYIF